MSRAVFMMLVSILAHHKDNKAGQSAFSALPAAKISRSA
jgi:hypothetical protein